MHFEIYQEQQGMLSSATGSDYRWRLVADNGRIIANGGEGYRNRADCEHGISLVKGTTSATPVTDKANRSTLLGMLGDFNINNR